MDQNVVSVSCGCWASYYVQIVETSTGIEYYIEFWSFAFFWQFCNCNWHFAIEVAKKGKFSVKDWIRLDRYPQNGP